MSKETYLSVIIPAFNEEKRIKKTLREIAKYLGGCSYGWEIIVVSDGSTDRTEEIVKNMASEIQNLSLIATEENYGKGYGVKKGMLEAEGEYRVFTDADNSTTIDHIEKMWPEFEKGYGVVIGSRDMKGARLAVPQPWWRRFIGDIFNLLVQVICGLWGIWDTQCGFKGFSKKAAEEIFPQSRIEHFAFDPEILVIAKRMGYRIKRVPVTWINDPNSKVKLKNMFNMGIDLLRIRLNIIQGKYGKK